LLDIGCGNGWMTNRLHQLGHTVAGIDLNKAELEQAEQVFGTNEKMQWIYADVLKDSLPVSPVEAIVLAASCQYFPDLNELTKTLAILLKAGGEIHLLDSMFYKADEQQNARQRTQDYYEKMGHPEMSEYYHHHTREALLALGYQRKDERSFLAKILNRKPVLEWWIWKKPAA